jgi:hypothetical protein
MIDAPPPLLVAIHLPSLPKHINARKVFAAEKCSSRIALH